ncbi:MAG: hypothetical protein WDM84_07195 [Bauldia sp.]
MPRQASRRGSNGGQPKGGQGPTKATGPGNRKLDFRVGFYVFLKVCMTLFLVWLAIQLIGVIVIWVTIAVR